MAAITEVGGRRMTREEQISNGFTEMMKGVWGNQDLKVPDFEEPCKQEPCEDCISRLIVQEEISKSIALKENSHQMYKRIQAIPPVTPQPFINKPCVSEGVCREDKIQVLDKIRAEIEQLTITEGGDDYVRKMAELFSLKMKVLHIIDKYKAEMESDDGN